MQCHFLAVIGPFRCHTSGGYLVIRSALIAVFAVAALSSFAAEKDELFVAKPLTEKQSFTPGIEGPACDAAGNLITELWASI